MSQCHYYSILGTYLYDWKYQVYQVIPSPDPCSLKVPKISPRHKYIEHALQCYSAPPNISITLIFHYIIMFSWPICYPASPLHGILYESININLFIILLNLQSHPCNKCCSILKVFIRIKPTAMFINKQTMGVNIQTDVWPVLWSAWVINVVNARF